jgi:chemotaxis protein MotB
MRYIVGLLMLTLFGSTVYLGGEYRKQQGDLLTARADASRDKKRATELEAQLEAERASKTQATEEVAVKDAAQERLIAELKSKLGDKDGDVSADAKQIRVSLVDSILFESGKADISPRGQKLLEKVGVVLRDVEGQQILVGGHTDTRRIHNAQFPSNWELSSARSVNVVHYLQDTAKVAPQKLAAASYAEFHPRSKKNFAKNRRIEILLTPAVQVERAKLASR